MKSAPLLLTFFRDCGNEIAKPWLIKNVIAMGETSAWIAPPGAGKSALLTSVAISVAAEIDWYGFRIKAKRGVVSFAFERGLLVERRLKAHRLRNGLDENLPIAVAKTIINLMDPSCVELLYATLRDAEEWMGIEIGLATFDTYNKGIAFGGGDEDKARDQNRALANLRRLQERYGGLHIALVGHTGKDEGRGARGSNAFMGDADVQNQISSQGDIKIVTTIKGNDQGNGELLRFKMQPYELGTDEDGDPIEVWIASSEVIGTQPTTAKAAPIRLTAGQKNAFDTLVQVASGGISAPASTGPYGHTVTTLDDWRAEMIRRGVIDRDLANPREAFTRFKDALMAKRLIRIDGNHVWPINGAGLGP